MTPPPPIRVYDAEATRAALPFDRLVPALRDAFAVGCEAPPRQVLEIAAPGPGAPPMTSLVMPAWIPGRYYGVKVINIAPGNAARGLPGLHASYVLHDAVTGVPLALIDGDELTARRTAAVSALAASYLARPDARRLLVVGAGRVARRLPAAHASVRPIGPVRVWARDRSRAEDCAAAWRDDGFDAATVTNLPSAVAGSDIVGCATAATTPLIAGAWLRPGSHLDLIGAFTPAMREADDACLAQADVVAVDTDEALSKCGDLIGPLADGAVERSAIRTLAALARGGATGRRDPNQRTVFKSVGCALADLAAAVRVHTTATEQAAGD